MYVLVFARSALILQPEAKKNKLTKGYVKHSQRLVRVNRVRQNMRLLKSKVVQITTFIAVVALYSAEGRLDIVHFRYDGVAAGMFSASIRPSRQARATRRVVNRIHNVIRQSASSRRALRTHLCVLGQRLLTMPK